MSQAQKNYFTKMLIQLNQNKLSEDDSYQLFQDMVNTGYAWGNPELSLHSRMLIEKGCITTPEGYVHNPVTSEETMRVQALRENKSVLH